MITLIQIIQPDTISVGDCSERGGMPVASKLVVTNHNTSRELMHMEPTLELMEQVFAWFNGGSGEECPEFRDMRSLSVGDYVVVRHLDDEKLHLRNQRSYVFRCDKVGWVELEWSQMWMDISAGRNMPVWMKSSMPHSASPQLEEVK